MTADPGLTVGRYLRQEREKKGVSLDSVAKVTRITRENLEALERDDFQAISAPVFVRGFLRNYANYLGLDPRALVERYDSQVDLLKIPRSKELGLPPKDENPVFKYLLLLCVLLAGTGVAFYFFQKPSSPPPSLSPSAAVAPAPAPAAPSPAPALQPPPPLALPPAEKPAFQPPQPGKEKKPAEKLPAAAGTPAGQEASQERRHVLKAVAADKTWMRIHCDGLQAFDVLLQPKETAVWTARRYFEVTVGNAGGVELSLNGTPQRMLGKPGEVIHLILPSDAKVTPPPKPAPGKDPPPPGASKPGPPPASPAPSKAAPSPGPAPAKTPPGKETAPLAEPEPKEKKPSAGEKEAARKPG